MQSKILERVDSLEKSIDNVFNTLMEKLKLENPELYEQLKEKNKNN